MNAYNTKLNKIHIIEVLFNMKKIYKYAYININKTVLDVRKCLGDASGLENIIFSGIPHQWKGMPLQSFI